MPAFPNITKLKWVRIREVLPTEDQHFSPWLSQNLDLLADALGLDEIELKRLESPVENFFLDILATARDGNGSLIGVAIENQYGRSNHDHLGKLVTYSAAVLADYERAIAVWIVEEPQAAHVAAVEMLNRVSRSESVGWYLVTAKFTPAPEGYQVHFEKVVEPNEFIQGNPPPAPNPPPPERVSFMTAVYGHLEPALAAAGYKSSWLAPDGYWIRAYLPTALPASRWMEVHFIVNQHRFRSQFYVHRAQDSHAGDVLAGFESRHGDEIMALLTGVAPEGEFEWRYRGDSDRADSLDWVLPCGYLDAVDPPEMSAKLVRFAAACIQAVREDGSEDYPEPDLLATDESGLSAEQVMRVAGLVEAGEWTTYGDVAAAVAGTKNGAIAVGRIASTNADFPNPHRVLLAGGVIPGTWATGDGGGPAVARQRLEDEGLAFVSANKVDPSRFVDASQLKARAGANPTIQEKALEEAESGEPTAGLDGAVTAT